MKLIPKMYSKHTTLKPLNKYASLKIVIVYAILFYKYLYVCIYNYLFCKTYSYITFNKTLQSSTYGSKNYH